MNGWGDVWGYLRAPAGTARGMRHGISAEGQGGSWGEAEAGARRRGSREWEPGPSHAGLAIPPAIHRQCDLQQLFILLGSHVLTFQKELMAILEHQLHRV